MRIETKMLERSSLSTIIILSSVLGVLGPSRAAPTSTVGTTTLSQGFASPPESARPGVWWHWMNGNVTQTGIEKDLAWMHSVGIGRVDQIVAAIGTPQVVSTLAPYMSAAWKSDFQLAAKLAGQYGIEFGTDSAPGWSETGGPWVKPNQAMKKLVWSKTIVEGGKAFHGVLPQPPSNTGVFQNVPMAGSTFSPAKFADLKFYRDGLVIAYKEPVADPAPVSATANSTSLNPQMLSELSDGSFIDGVTMTAIDGKASLELRYAQPARIEGLTLADSSSGRNGTVATIYVSDNGSSWKQIARLEPRRGQFGVTFPETTVSVSPVTARYARIVLAAAAPERPDAIFTATAPGSVSLSAVLGGSETSRGPLKFEIHELVFHAHATVNDFATKAYFSIAPDYYALASKAPVAAGTVVNPKDVVNLTDKMKPDGSLDWTPPPGRWVVLRMGYSLEGTTNHPAPASATGLEVDKLSRTDVKSYMEHYLDMYQALTRPFGHPGSMEALTNDSTEVGMQNWTENMLPDFQKLNGYSLVPWLPALTGVVVGSPAESDRALWDFRHTINELLATNHYEEIAEIAHARGLFTYGEALESGRPTFGDGMRMRQYASAPMGALWTYGDLPRPFPVYLADLRGAASVADIYGQNIVAAESMTSAGQPWAFAPRELKRVVDNEFAIGVNRVFVHESTEQPLDKPPGLSLSIFGQMFNRLDTWSPEAGPWVRYMARCSYLLQQGHYAADIAYFYGQDAPLTDLFQYKQIDVPHGYGFNFVNPDVLFHELSVKNGRLVTQSGMRYRVLYLGGSSEFMTLNVLQRIDQLVRAGATVVGRRPVASPSLRDNPAQFQALAAELFGAPGSIAVRHVGAGMVFTAGSLPEALAALHLEPDFQYSKPEPNTQLIFNHRRLPHGDIYFVSNQRDRNESLTTTFRVTGYAPQLWNAVTGSIKPVSFKTVDDRTSVSLDLPPYGSIFVVFRKPAAAASETVTNAAPKTLLALHGSWEVAFQPDRGAPAQIDMRHLASWTANPLSGVRYFSGTGTYQKTFRLPAHAADARLVLDLGQVWELAKVGVNGKPAGIVWTPPFRLDITKYVHPGENTLSVAVTNLWVNRLIGDAQPNVKKKYTFTTIPTYEADAPLRVSGLLGPVRIQEEAPATGVGDDK